jgi:hypothetical protein
MNIAAITSGSTGNVAAGQINVGFDQLLKLSNSFITTRANGGNGGAITLQGSGNLLLLNSAVTTSVTGGAGNGGDLQIQAQNLVMDSGTIKANAQSGNGGNINLQVRALVPSGNTLNGKPFTSSAALLPGPDNVRPNNIIEAVSATGVSGTINLTAPQLNLSGVLANIGNTAFDSSRVKPDTCTVDPGSSLTVQGRGGLLPKGDDLPVF